MRKNKLSKILCTVIMMVVILASLSIKVQAAMQLDPSDDIKFTNELIDAKGVIEISRSYQNYQLYYQLVEVDDNTYTRTQKIKDTLEVIQALRLYELEKTEQNYIRYVALQDKFEAKYGERVQHGTEADVEAYLNELNDLLSSKMYNEDNWIRTTSNMFEIDLSKFAGNKNYIVWAKLVNADTNAAVYDANIYRVEGTGSNNNDDDNDNDNNNNTTTNTVTNNTTNSTTNSTTNNTTSNQTVNTTNTIGNDTNLISVNNTVSNTTNNNSKNNTSKSTSSDINTTKDSSTAKKSIPQTGAVDLYIVTGIGLIAIVIGTISYTKYRKIK